MAKYRITSPAGESFEITAPDDATPEQVQSYAQQQFSAMKPGPVGNAANGGKAAGVTMGLRDPIDAGAQMLRRIVPESVGRAVDTFGNWLADKGLPVARSDGVAGVDKIVKDVNHQYEADRTAAGREGFDWARLGGNVVNPVNAAMPSAAGANTVRALATVGAKAGAASGALQPVVEDTDNFWAAKAKQTAAGAVGGAVATPVIAKGVTAAGDAAARLFSGQRQAGPVVVGGLNRADLDAAVRQVIESQGMRLEDAPKVILDSVRKQVGEALAGGASLDGAAAVRRAQAEALGLTGDAALTAGQLTRDPIKYAQERNLSGVVINTPQGPGNPLATRFQNQNNKLQAFFDEGLGARGATDANSAGQSLIDSLRAADRPAQARVDSLYDAARSMNNGRAAELNRGHFNQAANTAIDEGMLGRFLPGEVRGLMNDIAQGTTPFNVDAAVQIDGILSQAQLKATRSGDKAASMAIGKVRDALHGTPLVDEAVAAANPGMLPAIAGPGGQAAADTGATARAAFDEARRAARSRFATIEQTPALKAALEGEAPDSFVRTYVLGADARDLEAMKKVLGNSPAALAQARAQVAATLKTAAFGQNQAGDAIFSPDRFAKTLQAIGPARLRVFFTPDELVRLNLSAKVAADINSVPAGAKNAVNYSNTGSAVFNLLQKISEVPGLRQIPGARALANQAGEIAQERAVNSALQPAQAATKEAPQMSPQARAALQRLFAPGALAGGAALGSGF